MKFLEYGSKTALGAVLFCTTTFAGDSFYDQPVRLHCSLSTRVVAMDLELGIDPLLGYVSYKLDKYHASNPAETYKKAGVLEGTATFKNEGRQTEVTFLDRYRPNAQPQVKFRLRRCGPTVLDVLEIEGVDQMFKGVPPMQITCKALS